MKKTLKIAMIGLGSIGARHLFNIVSVLKERNTPYKIDLVRSGKGTELTAKIQENINAVYYSYDEVPNDYDVIFVTNPTNLHFDTINSYSKKTKHMFIEKPVFDKIDIDIEVLALPNQGTYYVACPLRYTDVIQYLKHECDLSEVYSIRVISSSYLPDWRPNLDYRETYSAQKEQGGGVSIDLIHEWDYISYLFGQPEEVFNLRGKFSNLEINSDDLSVYIAKYKNMLAEVHLDYFGKKTIRNIELFTRKDTIIGDLANSEVRYLESGKVVSFKESRNDFQRKEISFFFDVIEGEELNHNDIHNALRTLKITMGGESK